MSKITKLERKLLQPFFILNYDIQDINNGRGFWDGDHILPVKIGPVIRGLIEKGFLSEDNQHIWPNPGKADRFKCKAENCNQGNIYDADYNDLGKCPVCDGYGLLLKVQP